MGTAQGEMNRFVRIPGPIVAIGAAETLFRAGSLYLFPALFAVWERELGWDKTELAIAYTLALGVSALASPAAGAIIDRGHGRKLLAGSAVLCALFLLALGAVESIGWFYAAWVGLGLAMAGGLYEPCFAFLVWARSGKARRSIAAITLIAGFAGALSFPLANALADVFNWRVAVFAFAGLIGLVAAPLFWFGAGGVRPRKRAAARSGKATDAQVGRAVRSPVFWLVAASITAIALNHGMVFTHLIPLLEEHGTGAETAVLVASLIGPVQVAGRIAFMSAGVRISPIAGTSICLSCIVGAGAFLFAAGWELSLVIPFVLLYGAGWGVLSIVKPLTIRDLLGDRGFAKVAGLLAAPFLAASALAPLLGSIMWEVGGYGPVILCGAGLASIAGVCHLAAVRRVQGAPRRGTGPSLRRPA